MSVFGLMTINNVLGRFGYGFNQQVDQPLVQQPTYGSAFGFGSYPPVQNTGFNFEFIQNLFSLFQPAIQQPVEKADTQPEIKNEIKNEVKDEVVKPTLAEQVETGLNLVAQNEDKILGGYVDKELALKFFNEMQYDKGKYSNFHEGAINGEINAFRNQSGSNAEVAAKILEAINAANIDGDEVTTKEEFLNAIDPEKGLKI